MSSNTRQTLLHELFIINETLVVSVPHVLRTMCVEEEMLATE